MQRSIKSISFVGCTIQIGLFVSLVGSEGLLLGLMAYDHYVAISHPLHYPILMSHKVCLQIIGSSWVFGLVDGLIQMMVAMIFPYCGSRELNHFFCEMLSLLKLACADTCLFENVIFACCVFLLLLPFSIIMASYVHVLKAVLHVLSSQAGKKALYTCFSHMTVVSLFYGAAMFIYLRPRHYRAPSHDKVASIFYTVLTPMLNPLTYSLRNQNAQHTAPPMGVGQRPRLGEACRPGHMNTALPMEERQKLQQLLQQAGVCNANI
ncbi:olfactory receptor 2V2-like [Saccopteryx bilineata]|uniref:olfactory receptor 2V2-like n=1 Tax=Saccopteryx bilineata TaxID=59482 RepID=UPI00338FBE6C